MRTYYQVCAGFKFSGCKPLLVSLSLHSSSVYVPYLVGSPTSMLSQSRYFHTVAQAQDYISFLYRRYPACTVPRPVLDSQQLFLF